MKLREVIPSMSLFADLDILKVESESDCRAEAEKARRERGGAREF